MDPKKKEKKMVVPVLAPWGCTEAAGRKDRAPGEPIYNRPAKVLVVVVRSD